MKLRNLSVLSYAMGFTAWVYVGGNESLDAMLAPGYFDDAGDGIIKHGDVLTITSHEGAAQRFVRIDGKHVTLEAMC